MTPQEQYHELSFYTLVHDGKDFIHQHIVDAYAAQSADEHSKPITVFFALAGLYLLIEKKYTGRQVQQAHQLMAEKTKDFVKINLPTNRGNITVTDVVATPPGAKMDELIYQWCVSVWDAFSDEHGKIIALTEKLLAKSFGGRTA